MCSTRRRSRASGRDQRGRDVLDVGLELVVVHARLAELQRKL
jgi:hypothetical protein